MSQFRSFGKWFSKLWRTRYHFCSWLADFGQTWAWPTLAKPTLANFSVSECWPTLARPTLANFSVLVLWPNFQPKKPKPQTQRLAFRPPYPNPKPGEREPHPLGQPSGPHPSGPLRSPPTPFGPFLFWVWPPLHFWRCWCVVVVSCGVVWWLWLCGGCCWVGSLDRPPDAGPLLRLTAQNFRFFFLLLPLPLRSFSVSCGNVGGVFEGWGP